MAPWRWRRSDEQHGESVERIFRASSTLWGSRSCPARPHHHSPRAPPRYAWSCRGYDDTAAAAAAATPVGFAPEKVARWYEEATAFATTAAAAATAAASHTANTAAAAAVGFASEKVTRWYEEAAPASASSTAAAATAAAAAAALGYRQTSKEVTR